MFKNKKIYNIYLYGSNVYGTSDEESDVDYIYIVDFHPNGEDQLLLGKTNINIYQLDFFQNKLNNHDVSALECFFLPEKYKIELKTLQFTLDLEKLRRSFSEKSSNSWVKAKKKIDVHQEFRIGMKSLFHSIRVLDFGIQIAKFGSIKNYTSSKDTWEKIKKQNFKTWNEYKENWQNFYNNLRSEFRLAAPK